MLCFICFCLFHSYYVTPVTLAVWGFVVWIQERVVVGLCLSQASVFQVAHLAPLSLIIAFGSVP